MAIGVIKVVNNTKYKEIPSTPKLKLLKFKDVDSDIN